MKTFKLLSILLLLLLGVFSCKDDFINQEPLPDIMSEDQPQFQMQSDVDPAPCEVVSGINIFIAPECGPRWTAGVLGAMAAYNATNTSINMVETANAGMADIRIDCEDFAETTEIQSGATINWAGVFGIAEVSNVNGGLGDQVFFNTDTETECSDPCLFQGVAMHELAHNLGLWHNENPNGGLGLVGNITSDGDGTFTFTGATGGIEWIPGTGAAGNTDPGSILNEFTDCGSPDCTFNANDLRALEAMFGICDCPVQLIDDPCECPELFPQDNDCFCVCYEFIFDEENWNQGIIRNEVSRTPVPCNTTLVGSLCGEIPGKVSYCVIESECTIEPEPEECECFCVCGFQVPPQFGGGFEEISREQVDCTGLSAGNGCGPGVVPEATCTIEIKCP